jgi:uncharacterized protein (TIGR03663 family)
MDQSMAVESRTENWLERILTLRVEVNAETLVYAALLLAAFFTRFYDLETRVMSHDESLHTYYSWQLERGGGFAHTPLMHGPLQFHLVALSYFLFGDTDATARIPAALAGIAAIGMMVVFRRWLGTIGALVAAGLMLISPYMLYYSRYVRNEAFVVVLGLLMFWAIFRYFETRRTRWLYLLAVSMSLHFTTKETAFIYIAQALFFLAGFLIWRLVQERWRSEGLRNLFLVGAATAVVGTGVAVVAYFRERAAGVGEAVTDLQPLDPGAEILPGSALSSVIAFGAVVALIGGAMIALAVIREFRARLRTDFPALDLVLVMGTLTLPHLGAIPASILGWDALAYQDPVARPKTIAAVVVLVGISLAVAWAWNLRRWLPIAGAFFLPFFLFFTTLFTNSDGLQSGLVGSLGYWLVQHGIERGSQPEYYYAFIQLPLYEYLPVIGAAVALFFGLRSKIRPDQAEAKSKDGTRFPVLLFLAYWAVTSFVGYSFAGERMPWLTVHIALPLILLAGWGIGRYLESVDWSSLLEARGWLIAFLILVLLLSAAGALGQLLGPTPPFAGSTLDELRATNGFLAAGFVAVGSAVAIAWLSRGWSIVKLGRVAGVLLLAVLVLLTARTAFRAAYINFDNATEFMVYAHGATGVKSVMDQVEDLSRRTTDGLSIRVAFDDDVSWPINWYMRNFNQALYYGPSPSRDLLNYPVVIAGDNNWSKVDPLMEDRYHSFEYIRMWWPTQDYFGDTWTSYLQRLGRALLSKDMRGALWDIWINRDYGAYAEVTGRDFSLENWSPSDRMKLYVRKDIAALIWDYGVTLETLEIEPYVDPYADLLVSLEAMDEFGGSGNALGQLSGPRGMAIAPNGEIYIADTMNHRVQRFSAEGEPLGAWGAFGATGEQGEAPEGAFNEPWDVAVGPDGSVYVADTWNGRIQRFTADGEFISAFGSFGQSPTDLLTLWGPRAVAVDGAGRLFVADTGNKRIVIYDSEGEPLGQFGGFGLQLGGMDEPVGVAIDGSGRVYVADTWNRRVQVFEELGDAIFTAVAEWPIDGWLGQSLENKPYLSVNESGRVCVTDPEGYRVLCFTQDGRFELGWGGFGAGLGQFGLPIGVAFSDPTHLWVVDGANDRLMLFETE